MSRTNDLEVSVIVGGFDPLVSKTISRTLRRRGYIVHEAERAHVPALVDEVRPQLLVLEIEASSLATLERVVRRPGAPTTIVVGPGADVSLAVRAMRLGALDYLDGPVGLDALSDRIDQAIATATVQGRLRGGRPTGVQVTPPASRGHRDEPASVLVAHSEAMRKALTMARAVASSPRTPALLLGESGAGKEVMAQLIHSTSARAHGPLVRVNVTALPDTMVEAELFGSTKGAFTDARRDRDGLIASADGGTLLLDELAELSPALQPKLLRVVEEHAFYPVGSEKLRHVDVRFLAATNREPHVAIAAGRLRRDLFYRLGTILIRIPPLRDRRADVLPIASSLLARLAAELERGVPELDREAQRRLLAYHWPGNVRELRNVLERAMLLTAGHPRIGAEAILFDEEAPTDLLPFDHHVTSFDDETGVRRLREAADHARTGAESEQIRAALRASNGSMTRAAELLGISRTTLWSKMRRYQIR